MAPVALMSTCGAHPLYFYTIPQLKGSRLLGEIQGWDSEGTDNFGMSFGAKSIKMLGWGGEKKRKKRNR